VSIKITLRSSHTYPITYVQLCGSFLGQNTNRTNVRIAQAVTRVCRNVAGLTGLALLNLLASPVTDLVITPWLRVVHQTFRNLGRLPLHNSERTIIEYLRPRRRFSCPLACSLISRHQALPASYDAVPVLSWLSKVVTENPTLSLLMPPPPPPQS
jgi:hypothetical protein